ATPSGMPIIPYPAIEKHGLIGDRRTAALVAADGTVDWLCLPDYDSPSVFGALLDWSKGGYWRLGPAFRAQGSQSYLPDTVLLQTRWDLDTGSLLLSDAMLWPENQRPARHKHARALVRCLRCDRGRISCRFDLQPAHNFSTQPAAIPATPAGYTLKQRGLALHLWSSAPLQIHGGRLDGAFELQAGQALWFVLEWGSPTQTWSVHAARSALEKTRQYWRDWAGQLDARTCKEAPIRRTALTVHLLTYAPEGSVVAAPTTSLPERVGGGWNADYRLCWVRDASLAVGMLTRLGDWHETEFYLRWLAKRRASSGHPLQVLYDVRGGTLPRQRQLPGVAGYRDSQPVRVGNHAYHQHQFGSLGFLADCTWLYLQHQGTWRKEYWELIRHGADYTLEHWREPDNGLWELPQPQHYVHSRVLCWVMLDRAIKIAHRVNRSFNTERWERERSLIHQEVMEKGWSDHLGAFRQRYEGHNLDAAELLIPVMEFLPGDHPRVLATIDRIAESLTIDGFVYRFNPLE
ncbi:MAG TPA: glycoside hydrolase family 15 protein, partial [Candidatus Sulfotelmatobacter sp.]|nr:glycoside hydrolase family 15 protein [Candidatus Sulfotelmatobacter sp.]